MKLLFPVLLAAMSALPVLAQMPPIEPGVSHDLAIWRASHYSDVRYKLNLTLEKMSPVLKGTIEIRVTIAQPAFIAGRLTPVILDWRKIPGHEKDSTLANVTINGQPVAWRSGKEYTVDPSKQYFIEDSEHLTFWDSVRVGENVIKLDFTSPILTSGSAITRYIDKEDGSEYLYSLFVPSDASTAFPVFDQPDLKARFSLSVSAPDDWKIISNAESDIPLVMDDFGVDREIEWQVCGENDKCHAEYKKPQHHATTGFFETKPISTYVFAFTAGPWVQSEPPASAGGLTQPMSKAGVPTGNLQPPANAGGSDPAEPLSTHIYVRKSQAAKFQPHAAETFRLMREGIKYLESYFDYKFPWPKYDLVLIPEFPFGGMEHAGATFVREQSIIFPTEPTKSDYINRATLIFHETAHQWFGDTVTMRWFDDLWLKEGFAQFMAYKALEKIMPEMNAWKVFYERIKQPAYATDSTKGTTPIYQPIENLSAAKSAYGNIVYNKAPAFLRQAEFYLGEDKFQTAVRAFLKKHEFANATWQDLVAEFEAAPGGNPQAKFLSSWGKGWVTTPGVAVVHTQSDDAVPGFRRDDPSPEVELVQYRPIWSLPGSGSAMPFTLRFNSLVKFEDGSQEIVTSRISESSSGNSERLRTKSKINFTFPNYGDYGYGIFLLDDKSRDYVLKNIQSEKDDFLRSMMWGSLWDSVRETELDPREYVELAIKSLPAEKDETITASVLGRVSTAMTYYIVDTGGNATVTERASSEPAQPSGSVGARFLTVASLPVRLEALLIDRMRTAPTLGQRVTYYRAFLNIASTADGRNVLKEILKGEFGTTGGNATVRKRASGEPTQPSDSVGARSLTVASLPVKTKDRFDIVTRLAILGDPEAPKLLADLEKTETSDDAKRYAYAAHAAFATTANREKFWNDFVTNKEISESWIEAAMNPFNSPRHADLSLPYLERALKELPNQKRNRKIFFVNGWLGAFIGGQKSQQALDIVNKFLADNPNLDKDLRLKILENADTIERAVKIRAKYQKS